MIKNFKDRLLKKPPLLLFVLYLVVIILGTFILMLPISSGSGKITNFTDSFFTAASAFCVTGLVQFQTSVYWSIFGKVVILILIQLGGLGIMTMTSFFAMVTRKKITLQDRKAIQEETNSSTIGGMVKLIQFIIVSTVVIELIGAVLLSFAFIPKYGSLRGIWYSVFHSISAYCNAGFDIIGDVSLSTYVGNVLVSLTIAFLIILGGIGFGVYRDILFKKSFKKFALHTKVVLMMTGILLGIGTILFLFLEWNNPDTLGKEGVLGKILGAFFQSTTTRTAGFFTFNQTKMTDASAFLTIALMLIGGSPQGTAGGLKTTTFATMMGYVSAELKNKDDIVMFKKRLKKDVGKKAVSVFIVELMAFVVISFILMTSEKNISPINILFEVSSAIGTVGLTRGVSPLLSIFGKFMISFTMIFGKIGPLSMLYAFSKKSKPVNFKEAEESIVIG